jgi:hypothetical protein
VHGFVGQDRFDDQAIIDMAQKNSVLFLDPRSGSLALRKPYNKYILNLRSSVVDQASAIAYTLYNDMKLSNILIIWQTNSSYWEEAKTGFVQYITVVLGGSAPHIVTLDDFMAAMAQQKPQAVVILADYSIVETVALNLSVLYDAVIASVYDENVPSLGLVIYSAFWLQLTKKIIFAASLHAIARVWHCRRFTRASTRPGYCVGPECGDDGRKFNTRN